MAPKSKSCHSVNELRFLVLHVLLGFVVFSYNKIVASLLTSRLLSSILHRKLSRREILTHSPPVAEDSELSSGGISLDDTEQTYNEGDLVIDLIKEMSRDWLGRFLLALTTFTIGLLGWFGVLIWQSMHDGVKCAEQRFSHFQPVIVTVGKITTVNQIPIYECVRSVAAPEELKAAKQAPTVVDR